jgi:hypothetical protein
LLNVSYNPEEFEVSCLKTIQLKVMWHSQV